MPTATERHEAAARASQRSGSVDQKREAAQPVKFPPPPTPKPETPKPPVASIDEDDPVDQASYDSFPASDPPAHSGRRDAPRKRAR